MGLRHFLYANKKQKSKKKQSKNKLGEDSDPSPSVVSQKSGNHDGGRKRIITDSRFSFVHSDPRFQNVPKHRAKVSIDSRFDRMFVDKNFLSSASLDKRGKPKVGKSKNPLRHYYRIEDENEKEREQEESGNDQEENEEITPGEKKVDEELKGENRNLSLAGDDSSSELDTSEAEEDAASSESEYEIDTDEDELDDVVYEDDIPVETIPEIEKETRRLAIVNMDWRYIKAEHLYMTLSSFLPKGGQILCVSVYPSDFGLQRMKEEEVHGPVGLFDDDEEEKSDDEDGGEIDEEKLRAYELSRLRYYYAVVECDSVATADYLYKTCDGVEFERSSNVLDLRFIPDSMEFKHPPRDIATQAPGNYEAVDFHTSAMQKSKIDLSWEEDEPQRVKKFKRKFDIDKDEQDFREFLASGDSDTDPENEDESGKRQKIEHDYRALMQSGSGSDRDDERGGQDMEVTFNTGLEDLSKRILEKKEKKSETVWESILRKKQEKKKARKNKSAYSSEDDDSEFSDQEAVEADDFFIEEPVVKRSKREKDDEVQTTDKDAEASVAELELLLADGQDANAGIKGFNLKPKMIKERKGKKVRKGKKALDEEKIPTVDYNDPRFSALFVSPLYALDPTDPQFKRSAAYARQMALKQQKGDRQGLVETPQRKLSSPAGGPHSNKDDDTQKSELFKSKKDKYELSSLVRSIKMKSRQGHPPTNSKMDERVG